MGVRGIKKKVFCFLLLVQVMVLCRYSIYVDLIRLFEIGIEKVCKE